MSDYKLLKEAYLDNTTEYLKKYSENFNVRTTPAVNNERGTLLLSNPNIKALYRVIRADPNDSSLYDIALNFEKPNSNDVTLDIKYIFKELCLFPSSSFSKTVTEKNYIVSLQKGDTVAFLDPKTYGKIIQGGIYDKEEIPPKQKVKKHKITTTTPPLTYYVNMLDPITITKYNSDTCNTIERDISKNSNVKQLTYIYKKVPLNRLIPQNV